MKLSQKGALLLAVREGKKEKAYKDTKGIWTIGIGHTGPEVKPGLVWTEAQIMSVFKEDVKWAEDAVNAVEVPLAQHQFDALVSFVFNVGANAFAKSTMLKLLNEGDFYGAEQQFNRWVIPKEITGRRMSEKKQFAGE